MKKFFIAFLILAVTAANVFAQITFDGSVFGQWDVIAGESGKTRKGTGVEEVYSGWLTNGLGLSSPYIRSRLNITAANEDKTWGGSFRIQESAPTAAEARVWWQPISQVKAVLGKYGFRPFGTVGGLGVRDYLNAGAVTDNVIPDFEVNHGFVLELAPITNLKIGVFVPIVVTETVKDAGIEEFEIEDDSAVIPVGTKATRTVDASVAQPAEVSFRRTRIWAGYTLEGIGTIALGFKGSSKPYTTADDYKKTNLADADSTIYFGFDLTAIQNLKLQLGAAYPIPQDTDGADVKDIKLKQNPIAVKLAADYTVAGTFGVRALIGVDLGGKTEYETGKPTETGLAFKLALDPWANVGVGTAGLAVNLTVTGPGKVKGVDDHGDKLDLVIIPYFQKVYGGGTFTAGFKLGFANFFDDQPTQDDESGKITWAIPVGLSYSF